MRYMLAVFPLMIGTMTVHKTLNSIACNKVQIHDFDSFDSSCY